MEWLPSWEQLGAILVLILAITAVFGLFSKAGDSKRKEKNVISLAILDMQNNIATIMRTIAQIEGKMDTGAKQIIDLERKHALSDQKLDSAWKAIDKIIENCDEVQREKRKGKLG